MTTRKMTQNEWVGEIKDLLEDPNDRRVARFARQIVAAINQSEHDAFMEAKAMMQKQLDQMHWDL